MEIIEPAAMEFEKRCVNARMERQLHVCIYAQIQFKHLNIVACKCITSI